MVGAGEGIATEYFPVHAVMAERDGGASSSASGSADLPARLPPSASMTEKTPRASFATSLGASSNVGGSSGGDSAPPPRGGAAEDAATQVAAVAGPSPERTLQFLQMSRSEHGPCPQAAAGQWGEGPAEPSQDDGLGGGLGGDGGSGVSTPLALLIPRKPGARGDGALRCQVYVSGVPREAGSFQGGTNVLAFLGNQLRAMGTIVVTTEELLGEEAQARQQEQEKQQRGGCIGGGGGDSDGGAAGIGAGLEPLAELVQAAMQGCMLVVAVLTTAYADKEADKLSCLELEAASRLGKPVLPLSHQSASDDDAFCLSLAFGGSDNPIEALAPVISPHPSPPPLPIAAPAHSSEGST